MIGRVRLAACAMITVLGVVGATVEASAATPEGVARSSARKRGYTPEQTRCFVPIFANYASLNRHGHWVAGSRRRGGDVYRHEVYARCGVMR
mgnify:CR=1 FL=1